MKKNIKDLSYDEVLAFFTENGEKKFRAGQLFSWLYVKNAVSFEEMTDFSKELRALMEARFSVSSLNIEEKLVSQKDGSVKYLFRTHDDNYIESVLLKSASESGDRVTVCVSSQIGCAMGCTFCRTSRLGIIRNLSAGEILEQISLIRRDSGEKNTNVVFMGMGEPFNNYDEVIRAAKTINLDAGFNISVRRITISTCGILPAIERYLDEGHLFKLALSLNDTLHEKRLKNMPVENKYPVADVADLLRRKFPHGRNRLTLEYVMRDDNISKDDAVRIKKLFKNIPVKLNLIPLNPGADVSNIPSEKEINEFVDNLGIMNIPIIIRKSLGQDINGACGQLSGRKYKGAADV
ncbi:MAG: 23S rRNA (adenine(2503)-C(2))-methyltransferase RlmN [Spirochaetes bacterium]|nr:23S rRNA (adenine(2503)-C(2))-methyltransferase RlmN [Spirochaetota bacterium]